MAIAHDSPWALDFGKKQLIKVNTQKQQSRIHIHPLACIRSPKTSDCRQWTSTKQDSTNFIFSKRVKQKHRPDVTPKKNAKCCPQIAPRHQLSYFTLHLMKLRFSLGACHFSSLDWGGTIGVYHQCHYVPYLIGEMMINYRICWGIFSCHIFGQTAVFHQEIVSSSQTSDAWLKSR